jgi:transposase
VVEGRLRLRDPRELPAASDQVESRFEPEARHGTKRGLHWVGYKVHLIETCDDALPHRLTQVETTVAPASEIHQLAAIHEGLAPGALLPGQQLVDAGYVRARNLVEAREHYQVEVIGPIPADHQWQAKARTGFDVSRFAVDWDARVVTCPRGRTSVRWSEPHTARGLTMSRVEFTANDCTVCPVRPQCTQARTPFRSLLLQPRGARGDPGRAATPADSGVRHDLYPARWGRRNALTEGGRLRPPPGALSRPRQGPPAARRHGDRHERRPARPLARGDPAGTDPPLMLRGIGSRRMIGANSPTVTPRPVAGR